MAVTNEKDKEEIKNTKDKLEFLYNISSGMKDIKVNLRKRTNKDEELPSASIEHKEISLDGDNEYNKLKSEGFQELGHLWLSGSLKELRERWDFERLGDFDDFRKLVNMLEDIRTENLMGVRYPQIKNRLINLHVEKVQRFLDENPDYVISDPRSATYILAEDRFEIPIDIDPSIKDVAENIKKIIDKSEFREGNWKTMINAALNLTEVIKSWENKQIKPLQDELEKLRLMSQHVGIEYKELIAEQTEQTRSLSEKRKDLLRRDAKIKQYLKTIEQLQAAAKAVADPDLQKGVRDRAENLKEMMEKEQEYHEKDQKDVEGINDYFEQLTRKAKDIYDTRAKPIITKQTQKAGEIAEIREKWKVEFGKLPLTYLHYFDQLDEKKMNEGSQLTKKMIEALGEAEEGKEQEGESSGDGEGEGEEEGESPGRMSYGDTSLRSNPIYKPPEMTKTIGGSEIKKKLPAVKVFRTKDHFVNEGGYPIIDLRKALNDGYEISSELKRFLKLKAVTLKDRLSGSIDMKKVQRQYARYGRIVDPKVMKIKKKLVEKHNVLVLTDFSGCLEGDTLINVRGGILRKIKDINIGDYVLSSDFNKNSYKKVINKFKYEDKGIIRLRTSLRTIDLTPNHKIFISGSDGRILEKSAGDLIKGDKVLSLKFFLNPNSYRPKVSKFLPKLAISSVVSNNRQNVVVPIKLTREFCEIIGYILGDGNSFISKKSSSAYIAITDKDKENLEYYGGIIKTSLGVTPLIRKRERQRLYINSRPFVFYIKKEFPEILSKSPFREIPIFFQGISNDKLAALLRGLYDAEGSIGSHSIQFTTTSKVLAHQVQLCLHRFGIPSYIYDTIMPSHRFNGKRIKETKAYLVYIYNQRFMKRFRDDIGFNSKAKREKLDMYLNNTKQKRKKTKFSYLKTKCNIIIEEVKEIINLKSYSDVYDLEVEENHNYFANGLLVHNSMGDHGGKEFAKVQYAKQALVTLGKTLETLKVNYSLRGFSATSDRFQICDIVMKEFDEPDIDFKTVDKVFYPSEDYEDHCQNRDGSSIRHATQLLLKQRGKRLLIVISDGMPAHPSNIDSYMGKFGERDTKEAIVEAEREGINIVGISIDRHANNFVVESYPNAFIFNELEKFPRQLTETYIKAVLGR